MQNKEGNLIRRALNRFQRRRFKNRAQIEGKSKKFYTTKQVKKRKNGKRVRKNKTANK